MNYMLDTDTVSALVNGSANALSAFAAHVEKGVGISVITQGEILFGIHKRMPSAAKKARIDFFLEQLTVLPMEESVTPRYGSIRAALESNGQPIGMNDTWIAAHALSLGATLVTNNVREFKRVKGLKVENWV
jgi:tRNA(fMet)-specific endonuclease VapC